MVGYGYVDDCIFDEFWLFGFKYCVVGCLEVGWMYFGNWFDMDCGVGVGCCLIFDWIDKYDLVVDGYDWGVVVGYESVLWSGFV